MGKGEIDGVDGGGRSGFWSPIDESFHIEVLIAGLSVYCPLTCLEFEGLLVVHES